MTRLIAAFCAVILGVFGAARGSGAPEIELSVMSFNIRYDNPADGPDRWSARREQVFAMVRDVHPDVIGMQEVLKSQLDDLTAALPEYAYVGVGRDDGKTRGEYSCVLYLKEKFSAEESGTFWLSDTPDVTGSNTWKAACVRVCTWARLTEKRGTTGKDANRSFYVFNTHMDHQSQNARERGAELIAKRLAARAHADEPVVLTGDFNSGEDNAAAKLLTGPATGLVDSFRVAHPDEKQVGTFHAFKGKDTGEKIDYILVPKGTEVLKAAIDRRSKDGRYPSDHFPVTATVRLK